MVCLKIFILRFMSLTMVSQVIQWFHKKKMEKLEKVLQILKMSKYGNQKVSTSNLFTRITTLSTTKCSVKCGTCLFKFKFIGYVYIQNGSGAIFKFRRKIARKWHSHKLFLSLQCFIVIYFIIIFSNCIKGIVKHINIVPFQCIWGAMGTYTLNNSFSNLKNFQIKKIYCEWKHNFDLFRFSCWDKLCCIYEKQQCFIWIFFSMEMNIYTINTKTTITQNHDYYGWQGYKKSNN